MRFKGGVTLQTFAPQNGTFLPHARVLASIRTTKYEKPQRPQAPIPRLQRADGALQEIGGTEHRQYPAEESGSRHASHSRRRRRISFRRQGRRSPTKPRTSLVKAPGSSGWRNPHFIPLSSQTIGGNLSLAGSTGRRPLWAGSRESP